MDILKTVNRIRGEYRAYLREIHPDWPEKMADARGREAFYPYDYTIFVSFWKCFADEASMARARAELLEYFTHERMSDQAAEDTERYWGAMKGLKEFLDARGGVRACIGPEYDCEEGLYPYVKQVYEGTLTMNDAAAAMARDIPFWKETYHKVFISTFLHMMKGSRYANQVNTEVMILFISHIGRDYGDEYLVRALTSARETIRYNYEKVGGRSDSVRRGCARIAAAHQVDLDFGASMFEGLIPKASTDSALAPDTKAVRYWLWAAEADSWETCLRDGVMTIGWGELGDLTQYDTRDDIRARMKMLYGDAGAWRKEGQALWQFTNEVKEGDIIFAVKGKDCILCRGVVEGEYTWDAARGEDGSIRTVRWGAAGAWTVNPPAPVKILTDMTSYTEFIRTIEALLGGGEAGPADPEDREADCEPYTEEDFLRDVYMDEKQYDTLKKLVLTKKNVILQGAPGVGKTYAAKRLAYSLMGEKDNARVSMVQFHQSYSYEDFVMGYRPTETGFKLETGAFYEFCRRAADDDRPYFFLIDEINRGNLSKILGELFMLIESDKRGVELQLLYAKEQFSIPANVYIIGMMNTADRSLAMLDYALRRRFAFFEMKPAFASSGFRAYRRKVANPRYDRLIDTVEQLNRAIAEDETLGKGFSIGHSYFCTDNAATEEGMRMVVDYELIPLLQEYWYDEPAKVGEWSRALREAVQ